MADATPRADDEQHTKSSQAAAETQEIKVAAKLSDIYAETVWTALSHVSLQNLQANPGTTIYGCAIEENPTQKIRSARRFFDAPNPPMYGAVREGGRNDRCGRPPTNTASMFEGHIEEKLYNVQTSRSPYRPLLHEADLQA
ncbi:MAG: hypothetical protein WCA85_33485 [Paraburkholderia sp.]|uniref:hypothetical protein n=1 Tax=Paraburkholderia sp. TaxID=1926495 RepID=UPI003C58B6B4